MRISEAGELLGVARSTAYLWADQGRIPTVDLGGERGRYVPRAALEALIAEGALLALEGLTTDDHRAADEAALENLNAEDRGT